MYVPLSHGYTRTIPKALHCLCSFVIVVPKTKMAARDESFQMRLKTKCAYLIFAW